MDRMAFDALLTNRIDAFHAAHILPTVRTDSPYERFVKMQPTLQRLGSGKFQMSDIASALSDLFMLEFALDIARGEDNTHEAQLELLERRCQKTINTLVSKAGEYAMGGDRLSNFKLAANLNSVSVEHALWGMATKHYVSVYELAFGRLVNTKQMVDEKVGDLFNYIILLEAVASEA